MHVSDKKLDTLNGEERAELKDLVVRWRAAKEQKDWAIADVLRKEYGEWDESLTDDGNWVSIFETMEHRKLRLEKRLRA